jgi:hypothetical protein
MAMDLFDHLPRCDRDTPTGTVARCRISKLRPTQNAVGRDEVTAKAERIRRRDEESLRAYLLVRTVPVVIGDGGHPHLIDHHHLAAAVLESIGDEELPVMVVRNWEPLHGRHFWKEMLRAHWMYPFAPDGGGPIPQSDMRRHVGELGNDIFRSVAWVARTQHAYAKSADDAIFAEFRWATFFRSHLVLPELLDRKDDLPSVTLADLAAEDPDLMDRLRSEIAALARSRAAAGLPGWAG